MKRTIGLVHATIAAIEPMRETLAEALPQVRVLNFLDEGILKRFNEVGVITPGIVRRLEKLVVASQESGAEVALLTCSSFSSTVNLLQPLVDIPVLAIDEMMIREAVRKGSRIGVIATVPGAFKSTQDMLYDVATREQLDVSVQPVLVEGAFEALLSGQTSLHDKLIVSSLRQIAETSDVVILAQVSMARTVKMLPDGGVPVLSSPYLAVEKLKEVLIL
jgi:Asp/Glu/hydantoin racemase